MPKHTNNPDWWFNGTLTQGNGKHFVPRQWVFPFLLLMFFLVLGPTPRVPWTETPGWVATSLYAIGAVAFIALSSAMVYPWIKKSSGLFVGQFMCVIAIMAFFLYAVAVGGHLQNESPSWLAATNVVFPHLWQPMALLVFLVAASARPLAGVFLRSLRSKIQAKVSREELANFVSSLWDYEKPPQNLSWIRSMFDALRSPVEILYPPALFMILIDSRVFSQPIGYMAGWWVYRGFALLLALAAYVGLVCAERIPFVASMRSNVQRILWYGGSWTTTAFVILLAGLWLADVSYITTVIEGSRSIVIFLVFASYALFWNYEYWVNHSYSEELLKILGVLEKKLYVQIGEFRVCIHGAAKLSIVKQAGDIGPAERGPVFTRTEFFALLFEKFNCPELGPELSGIAKMFFVALNTAIVIPVALFVAVFFYEYLVHIPIGGWVLYEAPTRILVEKADIVTEKKGLLDMQALLFESNAEAESGTAIGKRGRLILVAASGGGTRAALYTSSALDGLRFEGKIGDVKAVSGVSGGGAALAYFAAHRKELIAAPGQDNENAAWKRFHEAMAFPYITDVFCGASEFRIPWHTSISTLLGESLERQIFRTNADGASRTLGACEIGLIFNTTLVSESPPPFNLKNFDLEKFKKTDNIQRSAFGSGLHAGSRLIFTNLRHSEDFPNAWKTEKYPWNEVLRYKVVNDPDVRLARAASLNANFPPVFPNAPVDVTEPDGKHRYWVTDGGAEENRGQIGLLYTVRGAIERRLDDAQAQSIVLPDIYLVVVEASGGSVGYKQDNGVSAFSGAAQKFANQLALELERDIHRLYKDLHNKQLQNKAIKLVDPSQLPKFETHFLPMPSAFRIDGGVGTHWMLPETTRLGQPTIRGVDAEGEIYVDAETVQRLIRDLHRPEATWGKDRASQKIWNWRAEDPLPPSHKDAWEKLCKELNR